MKKAHLPQANHHLKAQRLLQGWSQEHMAEKLGTTNVILLANPINMVRFLAWSEGEPRAKTRTSKFAALVA